MLSLILYALLCICFFLGSDCGKELVVTPPPPPPPAVDTIITHGRELTDGEQPAVSPDGTKIAFTRAGDIYVMDTSGTNNTQLTSGAGYDIMPRWHPNGQTIGFIRKNQDENNKGLLFAVAPNGGNASQIILNQFIADSLVPGKAGNFPIWDWSPNAELVAFLQQLGVRTYLRVMEISKNEVIYLRELYADIGGNYSCFSWSNNDKELAFIGYDASRRSGLVFLLNLTTAKLAVDSSKYYPIYLCKSPTGGIFAYYSFGTVVVTNFQSPLYEYSIDGGPGLRWSPDGKFFLFENARYYPNPFGYRESRIGIYDIEQRKQYLLTQKGDIDRWNFFFDWGKNSREVYFERYKKINKGRFELLRK